MLLVTGFLIVKYYIEALSCRDFPLSIILPYFEGNISLKSDFGNKFLVNFTHTNLGIKCLGFEFLQCGSNQKEVRVFFFFLISNPKGF